MVKLERRKYERIDMSVNVELSPFNALDDETVQWNAESRNVSAGGLLVTADHPIDISSYVLARFTLPNSAMKREFVAKVVRVDELESFSKYDIGLEFVEALLPEDDITSMRA